MGPKVGVLGVGHFGRFHALKLAARGRLAGVHDADPARAAAVAAEAGAPALDAADLIGASDAVVVAAPTRHHHALAMRAIAAGRHLLVEKPLAGSMAEAEEIVAAAARVPGLVLQVGHIERFSAAVRTLRRSGAAQGATAYEAIRVAPFRPRGLDVSVVLDLMIHDLDLVLTLAGAPLAEVRAVGGAVMSPHPDFAVAQLRFGNGAAATVTASRVSVALERRLRALGPEGETRVDFLARSLEVLRRGGGAEPVAAMPGWGLDRATWTEHDSLEAEQAAFLASVERGAPVEADGAVALRALDAALKIEAAINRLGA